MRDTSNNLIMNADIPARVRVVKRFAVGDVHTLNAITIISDNV